MAGRRHDTLPNRSWSSDSHLLPAGIRHVARRESLGPSPEKVMMSEEPPVRPWQQDEPAPREKPPQRVRFQGSYDDYDEVHYPGSSPSPTLPSSSIPGSSSAARYTPPAYVNEYDETYRMPARRAREEEKQIAMADLVLQRAWEELDRLRVRNEARERERQKRERRAWERELEHLKREREREKAEMARRELYLAAQATAAKEADNKEDDSRPGRPSRASPPRARSESPPAVLRRRKRSASESEEDSVQHRRRAQSTSPPGRVSKTEVSSDNGKTTTIIYSDPESYDTPRPARRPPSYYGSRRRRLSRSRSPPRPDSDSGHVSSSSYDSDSSSDSDSYYSSDMYDPYDEGRSYYDFNPSSHLSRKPSQDASTTLSGSIGDVSTTVGSAGGERGTPDPSPDSSVGQTVVRPYSIYQSEYTGDGFPEGSHSVKLTTVLDSKRKRQPLFRWRHIAQTTMNFDEFSSEVGRIGGLTDAENHALNRLLTDVKKYCIMSIPTSSGYNVRHMEPRTMQVQVDRDNADKTKPPRLRTATWLCIPYFSLQKYAGPLADAKPGSYPTRTLLQEQYSGVSADRDMMQAVCQTGHVPPPTCFHVAQMWCVVLDDSLLITCGAMSDPTKKGGDFEAMIDLVSRPSQDPASAVSSFIYVYYSEAVMYALPTDQCKSWFAFISHFHEFWPNTLKFTHKDRLVTAADWPAIFNIARLASSRTLLCLKLGPPPAPPARGVLKSLIKEDPEEDDKNASVAEDDNNKQESNLKPPDVDKGKPTTPVPAPSASYPISSEEGDTFHVFSWLEFIANIADRDPSSEEATEPLQAQLLELEDFLTKETDRQDQQAYANCPESSREAALRYLEGQAGAVKKNSTLKHQFEDRVDVFNAAEVVFRFFLPLTTDGPTVGKFWGAVRSIVQMDEPEPPRPWRSGSSTSDSYYSRSSRQPPVVVVGGRAERRRRQAVHEANMREAREDLRLMTQDIKTFTTILCHAQPSERAGLTVPVQLIRAWIYVLLALAKATRRSAVRNPHFANARDLMREGMAEVMRNLPGEDLLKREVVLPMEVVGLLGLRLLGDLTGAHPGLDTVYSEYLNALDNEVATKPSERSLEHRINLLKQEATVINRIVGKQRRIFASLMPRGSLYEPLTVNLMGAGGGGGAGAGEGRLYVTGPASRLQAADDADYYGSHSYSRATQLSSGSRHYADRERESGTQHSRSSEYHRTHSRAPTVRAESYYGGQQRHESTASRHERLHHYAGAETAGGPMLDMGFDITNRGMPGAGREYYRLSPTRPGGFRDLLLTDCLALIDRRYAAFNELVPYANYLQEYNKNKWEDTKDRQEQAIYAFTIVTVVFLPLSAVAGIFGMNTADVRDMQFDQWLYWITAVPVTIAVILIGLWWMGELRNAFGWLPWVGANRTRGYVTVRDGGSARDRRRLAGGNMLLPATVMVPAAGPGGEMNVNGAAVDMGQTMPVMLRRRSVGPEYVVPDEYTMLETGRPRAGVYQQRPWMA